MREKFTIVFDLDRSPMFDAACLSMFDEPYDYTEELPSAVAATCDIYLLSDHCALWVRRIKEKHRFIAWFKDVVWSCEIGATKREPNPFELMVSRNALKADSCLFVDDVERNITVAKRMGMRTVHFKRRASIPDVYREIGLWCEVADPQRQSPTKRLPETG